MLGQYPHNIDAKGRLVFPTKLREELGDSFIVTKGLDNCLFVYSEPAWAELEKKNCRPSHVKVPQLAALFLFRRCGLRG